MHVEHLFRESPSARGRPRRAARDILNAILWIQQTGEKWHRLPASFPPQQTCYAKYIAWRRSGELQRAVELLIKRQRGDV
ncbi:transposase [Paraburkholderia phenazinium]